MDADTEKAHFDRAVAYFNDGRFYEAHEDWEELWHEAEGAHRLWLQGLIQYAAAFVHFARGFHASGFHRLMQQATEKVEDYDGNTQGLDWERLQADLAAWIEHGVAVGEGADLVKDAPGAPPTIQYVEGYVASPLPLDPLE